MVKRILKILTLFILFCLVAGIFAYFVLTLIIKSEDTVVVPDLVGKDVVEVLELLSDMGLNTKVSGSEYSSNVPKKYIIVQEPEPGSEIKKGRDVKIIISKGTQTIMMPNLRGLSIQKANILLEENDLHGGSLSVTCSAVYKKDEIIAQVPSPGSMTSRGDHADFLVSLGPRSRTYKMPDLMDLSIDDAILLIEQNNLILGEIKSLFDKDKHRNVIIGQEPMSGYLVVDGGMINLVVNRKGRKDQAYLHGVNGIQLFKYRAGNGILKRNIRIMVNCFGVLNNFFDEFVKPGEEVWVFIPKNIDATVFLYEDDELLKTQVFGAW
ncbi:MAG: PASTA domain-containing protein [Desulfobacterales bacterium]|nr:PASTA domain-containing protein [Desulfobacterales bacterium]